MTTTGHPVNLDDVPRDAEPLEVIQVMSARIGLSKMLRDQAIVEAFTEGIDVREIAAAAGMTRQGIHKVVQRMGNSVDNGSGKA